MPTMGNKTTAKPKQKKKARNIKQKVKEITNSNNINICT